MAGLALSLLGPFKGSLDGQALPGFRTLKVQALLVYLASECQTAHRREALMTLLWPGMPQISAQGNLRQVIYLLRKAIPPALDSHSNAPIDFLLTDHLTVQVNPAYPCQVDVSTFKELLQQVRDHDHPDLVLCSECIGRLQQAVELYRGDFLADFYLSDSNEFEGWASISRQHLSRCVLDALETLAEVYTCQNDYLQARAFAERQLQIDNLRESAYRQLMTIYALSGRRSEALALYETCRRLLADELGMAPTARTTALYEKILAGEVSLEEKPYAGVRGYELKEMIGSGSFGTVHRAIQTSIGREVAIKVIRPEHANNPRFIRNFEAEAQIVARLEHPHIAPLYDYWREPDRAFLVLRLFRGGSLQSALQSGPWSLEKVARLVEQIAQALNAAHCSGIVHRDLKPANILLDEEGNAYLSDFGVAVDQGSDGSGNRSTPASSLNYVSPEQILNDPLTPLTDIYSFGLVLFEALTGEKPFGQFSQKDLLKKQVEEPLPPLSVQKPELPPQLDAVIQRATAKHPQDRYQDALALAADFRRAARVGQPEAEELIAMPSTMGMAEINPYKGLRPFREEDAADFFGREVLIEQLLEKLSTSRFLAVVGPSGSGKSSVVSAGLIPRLRVGALPGSEKWYITALIPGLHPFEALEQALIKIAVNPPPSLVEPMLKDEHGLLRTLRRILPEGEAQLLLVIDQFEELYTLTRDAKQRDHFVNSLLTAIAEPGSPLHVVITLRADFYDQPLSYLPLGELLQEDTIVVLPLSRDELEQVVCRPAERVGARLEPKLMQVIAADVGDQPGALPLLQYALTELYEARQDHTLTLRAYLEMGGIAGALGRRAEDLYQLLDDREQAAARQVFLRLVMLGEGIEDTRRRVLLAELESLGGEAVLPFLDNVLDRFGAYRLLTFDRDPLTRGPTVEVAHEALLHEWSRLHTWLEKSRQDIRLQRLLSEAAGEWKHSGRDESYLLHGNRLDQFAGWWKDTTLVLTEDERAFIDASLQARQARQAEETERRARELVLEKRSRSVLRALVGVFSIATIVALLLSNYAFGQRNLSRSESQARATQQAVAEGQAALAATREAQAIAEAQQRSTAEAFAQEQQAVAIGESNVRATAQSELEQRRLDAEKQAQIARSRELASLAQLKLADDPELGMLLALEGLRTNRTLEAQNALRASLHATRLERTLYVHSNQITKLVANPDGKTFASSSNRWFGGTKVWDLASGRLLFTVPGECPTYRMEGEQLVTVDMIDEDIHFTWMTWSASTGEPVTQTEITSEQFYEGATIITHNWDKTRFAIGYQDGHVEIWDPNKGLLLHSWQAHDTGIYSFVYSQDGRMLASLINFSDNKEVKVWDSQSGAELFAVRTEVGDGYEAPAAFSPDGRWLATSGGNQNDAVIWDVSASIRARAGVAHATLRGHTSLIIAYAFSSDGARLATAAVDGTARVWSAQSGLELFKLSGHYPRVTAAAFTPDGGHLITGDAMGDIRIWDLSPSGNREVSTLAGGSFTDLEYSPDGSRFAAVDQDGHLRVWSSTDEGLLLDLQAHEGFAYNLAFNPDGSRIVTTGSDNRAVAWDAESGTQLFALQGHGEGVTGGWFPNYQAVAYSPDGLRLATGGSDGLVKMWDAQLGAEIVLSQPISLTDNDAPIGIISMAFSPDGRYLVLGGNKQTPVFDSFTGEKVLYADYFQTEVLPVSFSPDGSQLAVGYWGEFHVIDFPASLASGASVELFRRYTSQKLVGSLSFSPDGRYLVTAGRDLKIQVWDAGTGELLSELPATADLVLGVRFSPDGKTIRAASFDGTIRNYVVSTDDLIDLAYSRLTRWWRPDECSQYLQLDECPEPQKPVVRMENDPSLEELVGTWRTESVQVDTYLRFQEDGTLVVAQSLDGLGAAPLFKGTYSVDGISFEPDEICGDQVGRHRARLIKKPGEPPRLMIFWVDDYCALRLKKLYLSSYIPVAP